MPGDLIYIATAQALDDEMAERIARHRADRGERWHTIDAPIDLPQAIARADASGAGAILVDCLTLWVSNLMLSDDDIESRCWQLLDALRLCRCDIILVANEVGLGIVPDNALARAFRDAAGRLNQAVAAVADEVVMSVAGLPMTLKSRS